MKLDLRTVHARLQNLGTEPKQIGQTAKHGRFLAVANKKRNDTKYHSNHEAPLQIVEMCCRYQTV